MPAAVVKDGTVTPKFRQGKISPPFLTAKFSPRNSPPPCNTHKDSWILKACSETASHSSKRQFFRMAIPALIRLRRTSGAFTQSPSLPTHT